MDWILIWFSEDFARPTECDVELKIHAEVERQLARLRWNMEDVP